ncbi:ATP-dependent helicase [Synechococcus sp. CS-1324]|uniref:ATP-dependent helicase n=1 Tax=Synechococcus sp. CS-1324 TaxID=2847980 RepID=UPI000DB88654|nr:ATP-dependent helicase [Synechococcus sp. CS-1324]MCT0231552.1 ATP-dependent helicase [Synechococcus sp. CS-1324]PZV03221.1 MAG: damage-inducible protein [Cyanobium sp.]
MSGPGFGAAVCFTAGQQQAVEAFAAWLGDPAQRGVPFVLSGYAGTGKTFLSMAFLARVEADGLCWTVVAPTHKAVGVLRHSLNLAGLRPTWHPSTLHRLLRLKLRREGGREVCEETGQTALALEHLGLVLIDEASMVDAALLQIALQGAHPYGTRLVFVGDPAQLPPVGAPSSPVFDLQRACCCCLTEVVRHQGPVLRLATGLREQRLPCRLPPLLAPVREPEGEVVLTGRADWLKAAQAALRRAAECDNPDQARILCYTNRSLEQLVPLARRAIHGELADQLPVLPGEVLLTRMAVMAPACPRGEECGEEPDLVLASNRELVVRDVTPERCDLADFGVSDGAVIDTQLVEVESGDAQLALRLLPPAGSAGRRQLEEVLARLRGQALAAGKQNGRSLWRRYFLVRDAFASLGPAAVLTVHRSQGSTFGEVFIDADVFWPADLLLRRQLVYVAVSRARTAVWMVAGGGSEAERRLWQGELAGEADAGTAAGPDAGTDGGISPAVP